MGLAVFDFITIFFGGLVTFLVMTGVTGRMFVDVPPTGLGGESAADTTVATAK
jgi:hypothetical protein